MDSNIWLPLVLTIGALITGVGAWIQYANEQKSKFEAKQTELRADSLAKENMRLLKDVSKESEKSTKHLSELTVKLLEAQETIENLRKESYNNALGSDETYLVIAGPTNNDIVMYNKSDLPMYDVGLQIWDYSELQKCNIKYENGFYFIEKTCYEKYHYSEMRPIVYGNAYFSTNLRCPNNKLLKYRAFFTCRKGAYYVDLVYIPTKGSIARRFNWVDGKMKNIKIFNSKNLEVDWNKEFTYPPNFKFF